MQVTGNVKTWAGRYYLNEKSLIEMSLLINEITIRLERLGIKESTGVNRAKWDAAERSIILKVAIAGKEISRHLSAFSNIFFLYRFRSILSELFRPLI